MTNHEVYDCEIYPNLFTVCFKPLTKPSGKRFEISDRADERRLILKHLDQIDRMIGFNNLGFDWPLLNMLLTNPNVTVRELYEFAQAIIEAGDRKMHIIWNPSIEQLDLMRIHHFDNKAKMTSLKTLEFNMRMTSIEDMPFSPGSWIADDQIDVVLAYNNYDVLATERFYHHSLDKIAFREALNPRWLNYSDSKVGESFFIEKLEAAGIECFWYDRDKRRHPRQTLRPDGVNLGAEIFDWIQFKRPELQELLTDLKRQTIVDTYGSFERKFELGGLKVTVGLGGLHASAVRRRYTDGTILDLDVTSYYPNIPIVNRIAPQHLGDRFCDVYENFFNMRKATKKGSSDNLAIKLGLNSVFGKSNSVYSCFFDPAYMLAVTINGQLMLLMLAEMLLDIDRLELIQLNTDGVTVRVPPGAVHQLRQIHDKAGEWEVLTGMTLENSQYKRLFIRDVNNYIGEFTDGRRKAKGAYLSKREWHQNHGGLVISKGAEAALLDDIDPEAFVKMHADTWDFMFRVKGTKKNPIKIGNDEFVGTFRYYLSPEGDFFYKVLAKGLGKMHLMNPKDLVGKRGNWPCPLCSGNEHNSNAVFDTKSKLVGHIEASHAPKFVLCQQYEGEPINVDVRAYVSAIEELTAGFK